MTSAISTRETLAPVAPLRADEHPAAVHLSRLSPGSRRAMEQALRVVAGLLSNGRADVESFPWASIRYQHAQALRSTLADRYSPAAANKILSAAKVRPARVKSYTLEMPREFTWS